MIITRIICACFIVLLLSEFAETGYRGLTGNSNENEILPSKTPLFGSHILELRGQFYKTAGYSYQIEYNYRWIEYISTGVLIRKFPHASYEIGGGVTAYFPVIRIFYAQAVMAKPFQYSYPGDEQLPTCMIVFPYQPDYSYSFRGGAKLPLGDPARLPLFITFSAGKSWYVDAAYNRILWLAPEYDLSWPGEYEVRKEKLTRSFSFFEFGLGIYF